MSTFNELVSTVAGDLGLTSPATMTRIGTHLNRRYRRVASAIGMKTTSPGVVSANTAIGNRIVTFENALKLYTVYNTATTPVTILDETTMVLMRADRTHDDPPRKYVIYKTTSTTVQIYLDVEPETVYPITADAEILTAVLSGDDEPSFNENFHDILEYGAKADELRKLEKYSFAKENDDLYTARLNDLKYYLAVSAWKCNAPAQLPKQMNPFNYGI